MKTCSFIISSVFLTNSPHTPNMEFKCGIYLVNVYTLLYCQSHPSTASQPDGCAEFLGFSKLFVELSKGRRFRIKGIEISN